MPTLTIFTNFYINSEERFLRMQDSFNALAGIHATKWVINTRGPFKEQTNDFLQNKLGDKLTLFELESPKGWFHDTRQMLEAIDTDYVFYWIEDHICQVTPTLLSDILSEMSETKSDYLEYSWWHFGKLLSAYETVKKTELDHIYNLTLTKAALQEIEKDYSIYIISMAGIFSNQLFKKVILKTRLFLRQHPKQTPFNFEKGGEYKNWLPINMSLPKQELFAPVDDDNGEEGYSLQSRGLYPVRERRPQPPHRHTEQKDNIFKRTLPKWLYRPLIKLVITFNKVKTYMYLVRRGQ